LRSWLAVQPHFFHEDHDFTEADNKAPSYLIIHIQFGDIYLARLVSTNGSGPSSRNSTNEFLFREGLKPEFQYGQVSDRSMARLRVKAMARVSWTLRVSFGKGRRGRR
jgi:hypothetical protein